MLTGSTVSSLQGEPRSSHDIDFVVALTEDGVRALVEEFTDPQYYLDEVSMAEAFHGKGEFRQFKLLDSSSGDKVDSGCSRMILSTSPGSTER